MCVISNVGYQFYLFKSSLIYYFFLKKKGLTCLELWIYIRELLEIFFKFNLFKQNKKVVHPFFPTPTPCLW